MSYEYGDMIANSDRGYEMQLDRIMQNSQKDTTIEDTEAFFAFQNESNKLQTIKLLLTQRADYKELNEDCKIISASKSFIREMVALKDFELIIKFLDKNKGNYVEENNAIEQNYGFTLDLRDSFIEFTDVDT